MPFARPPHTTFRKTATERTEFWPQLRYCADGVSGASSVLVFNDRAQSGRVINTIIKLLKNKMDNVKWL